MGQWRPGGEGGAPVASRGALRKGRTYRTRPLEQERRNRVKYEFEDSQIDAHGFAAFCSHNLARFPSFSANFPPNELVLINRLRGSGIMEHEWPVFDFKGYWKV